MTPFLEQLKTVHSTHLQADGIKILQVNLGWVCNQACTHCHVNAGPHRTEVMELETIESILETVQKHNIPTVDITGGAPEINFHFRYLIEQLSGLGTHIIDRCNLTILFEPGMEDLPHFFNGIASIEKDIYHRLLDLPLVDIDFRDSGIDLSLK